MKKKKRIIQALIMLSIVVSGFFCTSIESFAASVYKLDVLIDATNGEFIGNVEFDNDYEPVATDLTLGDSDDGTHFTIDEDAFNEVLKNGPDEYMKKLDKSVWYGGETSSMGTSGYDHQGHTPPFIIGVQGIPQFENQYIKSYVENFGIADAETETFDFTGGAYTLVLEGRVSPIAWTFPSIMFDEETGVDVSAGEKDAKLAYRITETIIPDLNAAINWCSTQISDKPSSEDYLALAIKLGNNTTHDINGNMGGSSAFEWMGETFVLTVDENNADYLVLNSESGAVSRSFQYRIPKGYRIIDGVTDEANNSGSYSGNIGNVLKYTDRQYLTWQMIIYKGLENYCLGYDFYNIPEGKSSALTQYICGFLNDLLGSLRSLLGLHSLENLMMNTGARGQTFSYGLFPRVWMNAMNILNVICQILAWAAIGLSILRILYRKQMSTINAIERMSFMEEIRKLIITGCAIGLFPLFFNMLARINVMLVDLFSTMTATPNELTIISGNANSIGSLLIAILMFFVTLYFNFTYMVRAVLLALLYGVSPICMYSLSLGRQGQKVVSVYFQNLFGELFMQTFHALTLAFFCNITVVGGLRKIELLVVMYSFIPLTSFFQNIIQPERRPSQIADKLQSAATGVFGGITGAVAGAGASMLSPAGKGGSGSGGNGKANSNSALAQTIQGNNTSGKTGDGVGTKLTDAENKNTFANLKSRNPISNVLSLNKPSNQIGKAGLRTAGGVLKGAAYAGLGAATTLMGAGLTLAGNDKAGASLMGTGSKAFGNTISSVKSGLSDSFNTIKVAHSNNKAFKDNIEQLGFESAYNCNDGQYTALVSNAPLETNGRINDVNNSFNPQQKDLYQDMYNAFNGKGRYAKDQDKRKEAQEYYRRFGIESCGGVDIGNGVETLSLLFNNSLSSNGDVMDKLNSMSKFS